MSEVLYARIPGPLKERINDLALGSGRSISEVTMQLLADGLAAERRSVRVRLLEHHERLPGLGFWLSGDDVGELAAALDA